MIVAASGPVPASPYKGLVPYSEEDAPFFFGREDEQEIIAANLQAYRLTLLYGPSGVGKSSVLRAGVAHHLRAADTRAAAGLPPEYIVVVFASWRDDPRTRLIERVRASIAERIPAAAGARREASLVQTLARWTAEYEIDLLIILDQFEEYFLYHLDDVFAQEFAQTVTNRDLRVNVLISIRDDALARLDRFKGRIPGLFDNYLRLDHLDREAAAAAIERPLERLNEWRAAAPAFHGPIAEPAITIEPALRDAVLDQLGAGRMALTGAARGEGVAAGHDGQTRIETPYLQLVMARLWREERDAGSAVLRLATLTRLGGAERIVRTHLDAVMSTLTPGERHAAARAFRYLVTPSGSKIAHSLADLADYSGIAEARLAPLAEKLAGGDIRILRPVAPPASSTLVRYEIFHDVLAAAVADWRGRVELERRAHIETVLRPLQGWAWTVAIRCIAATVLIVAPILVAIAQDPAAVAWRTLSWNLPGATLVGLAVLAFAVLAALGRFGRVVAAIRTGFSWSAIADVAADRRGDIGDVAAGTGQYDIVGERARSGIRVRRRLQAALALLAAPVALAAIAAVVVLGPRGLVAPAQALGIVGWPALALLVGIVTLRLADALSLWRSRRRMRGTRVPAANRLRSRDSFEGLAPASPDGAMVRRAQAARWACIAALTLLPIAGTIAAVPFVFAEVAGRILPQLAVPDRSAFEDRIRIRQAGARLPPDPAIDPIAAGRAYYVLVESGRSEPSAEYEFPVPRRVAAPFATDEERNAFGESMVEVFETVITRAASGFSDTQRATLERIAAFDGLTEAAIVARAAQVDYLGARLRSGHPLTTWYYPIFGGLRNVQRPYLARAALAVEAGRREEAEAVLVEMISFASVTMDEGHSALEALHGANILDAGLAALEQVYAAGGAIERADAVRTRRADARDRADSLEPTRPLSAAEALAEAGRATVVIVGDERRLRPERWEALALVVVRPCTNTREIVFGPDDALAGTLRHVEQTLVRFPSEREWLDNMYVASGRPSRYGWGASLYGNLFARCTAMGNPL